MADKNEQQNWNYLANVFGEIRILPNLVFKSTLAGVNNQSTSTTFNDPLSYFGSSARGDYLESGSGGLTLPGTVTYTIPVERTVEPTNIPEMKDHRVNGSFGFKFRTPGGPILVTNALVPLRRGGLQSDLVWTVGLDLNF